MTAVHPNRAWPVTLTRMKDSKQAYMTSQVQTAL